MTKFINFLFVLVLLTSGAIVSASNVTADDLRLWSLTVTPPYQKVAEGSKVIFTCESSLPTEVRFQWTKPAKPIKDRDNVEIVQIAHNRSVLSIDEAHLRKHRRTFRCTAYYEDPLSQSVLDRSAKAVLKIIAKSKLPPNFPRVSSHIHEQLVESRPGMVSLFCEIEQPWSKQTPTFTWIKDSVIDLRLEKDNWESKDGMQILYVNPSQAIGEYQCAVLYKKGYATAYSDEIEADVIASYAKSMADSSMCTDYKGNSVMDGDIFRPGAEPCETCLCADGMTTLCTTAVCDAPPCRNYIDIPDTCCGFQCLDCTAYDGTMVEEGERYQPREDPCETCICERGQPRSCIVPRCQKPDLPCLNPLQIPGECCKFTCDEPAGLIDRGNAERDCVSYNGTRVRAGQMYAPESDPCKICTCDNGNPVRCMNIGCAIPPMPCKDPKAVPGVCCKFTCEERVAVRPLIAKTCVSYNGTRVAAGEMYAPESDPCKICTCDNGNPVRCMSMGCAIPPMPCEDPKPVPGVCCKFTCEERVAVSPLLGRNCISYNGTRVAAGQMYAPESDPCKICTCDNGNPVRCMSVGCAIPPMPCEDPKPVPGVCCKFTCEERLAVSPLLGRRCVSYNGTVVSEGQIYSPDMDACKKCICQNGQPAYCFSVACVPPSMPCADPRQIPGECCKFTCERPVATISEGKRDCVSYNGTMVSEGDLYHPDSDACKTCVCQKGSAAYCYSVACMPPKMPCPNPRLIPGQCCNFTCERNISEITMNTRGCVSYNGTRVKEGQMYHPDEDFCKICSCQNGQPAGCAIIDCDPSKMYCKTRARPVPGTCCEFTCDLPDIGTISVDNGCLSYNGTMVPFGARYQPTEDPCKVCECSPGDSVCMMISCAIPPMPCPNPRQLPNECCSFTCSESVPEANRERDNLDTVQIRTFVQQIGPQDVIVQWELPDMATFSNVSNISISFSSNRYSGHFEAEKGMDHVVVRGLNQSQLYNVVGVAQGKQRMSVRPVNPAAFKLDTRATTSLNLLDAIGAVYESRGSYDHGSYSLPRPFEKVMADENIQVKMNLNTFNMVETTTYGEMPCPKTECGLLRFYMYNTTGHPHNIMSLMFSNDMDFKWAKAHL